jgi:hypothetical protein
MSKTIFRIGEHGSVKAIVGNSMRPGVAGTPPPRRASHIEPIESGPYAGYWMADMSPMGPGWLYCLWPPLPTRAEALTSEHDHLVQRWIRSEEPVSGDTP